MLRLLALATAAVVVFVGFCCPPPALAFEKPQPMVCPITGQTCETREADCDPPAPQVATPLDAPVKVIAPEVGALPAAPELARPQPFGPATLTHWSAPTRTIVLRILYPVFLHALPHN